MKKFLIVLLIIILVPIGVLIALYFTVPPFTEMANSVLSTLPGSVGEKFLEKQENTKLKEDINEVADYLLKADTERAVDKLMIAENSDKESYDMLVAQMNRLDPNKMAKLLEEIKKSKQNESPIEDTLKKIREEKNKENELKAQYIAGLSLPSQVEEIKKILKEDPEAYKSIAKMFETLSEESVLDILTLLTDKTRDGILNELEPEVALDYKKKVYDKSERKKNLKYLAAMYQYEEADKLKDKLGVGSPYSKEELISIYMELGPKKTGKILSKINDEKFTEEILQTIRDKQIFLEGVDTFSKNLIEALNIYKNYDDKINELVSVSMKLDEIRVADTIKTLYLDGSKPTVHTLDNGETITFSDETLALDLLRSFSYKKIASILSYLDKRIASDIFTKLALPEP